MLVLSSGRYQSNNVFANFLFHSYFAYLFLHELYLVVAKYLLERVDWM